MRNSSFLRLFAAASAARPSQAAPSVCVCGIIVVIDRRWCEGRLAAHHSVYDKSCLCWVWKRKKRIVLVESSTIVAKDGETSQKNKKATTTWRKKKGTSRVCLAATVARCVLWIVKKKTKKQFYYVKVQLGKITKIHLHLDLLRLVPATITERKTFAKIFTGRLRPRGTTTGSQERERKTLRGNSFT